MIDQDKRKEIKNKLKNLALFKDDKFVLKIDLTTMNFIIAFITNKSSFRTRRNLSNCQKLFNKIHDSSFNTQGLIDRAWIIRKLLYAMLNEGIESDLDYLISYLSEDSECTDSIKDIIADIKKLKINYDECKHIVNKINDMLEYGYMVNYKEVMRDLINMIDDGEFKDYKSIQNDLYDIAVAITNVKRNARSLDNEQSFSLDPEIFEACIEDAVTKLQDKNRIFLTGIQRWNTILSPGYISKKLYVYLAFPGKGKSTVLLKSALDIKKYNPEIETKDPDKKPTVLFLTLENTLEETIERIYNMTVDSDDIRNYTPKQVIKKLRKDGGLEITNKNEFNIVIREFKNRELDTNDLYTLIMDEGDKGNEVVALVVDYMKRIRPAERANDEKTELKNISNELKEIAKFFDIVVITAQQLNRSSASVVDAALQNKKEDVTRLVGRDGIAGAWEILENSDFTCIINPEKRLEDGKLFLTFKLIKRRYRSIETSEKLRRLEYFNQPFMEDSEIRLVDDIGEPKPVSLESLSTQFIPVEDKRGATTTVTRTEKKKDKGDKTIYANEMDPFNFAQSDY